ncbi:hypothetical protein HBB16_02625 [Pseudonocardia sp. MCCB 268]|nr:hypothetical protein [Pseudonocardia cytotoxica]
MVAVTTGKSANGADSPRLLVPAARCCFEGRSLGPAGRRQAVPRTARGRRQAISPPARCGKQLRTLIRRDQGLGVRELRPQPR